MKGSRALVLLFLGALGPLGVEPKAQYVMPMSMGMKMSIPYDIANIFNRPIAGVISVVITVALALVILLGIITSPFGYFFGIPSRKYVLGGAPEASPRTGHDLKLDLLDLLQGSEFMPSFRSTVFRFLPERDLESQDCRLLVLCFGHGALQYFPRSLIRFYALFSKRLSGVPPAYKNAVIQGLGNNEVCTERYRACPDSVFSLLVKALLNFLPESVKGDNFQKRKQAMYM